MTDRDSTKTNIGDVVGSITSRLDATAILIDYIRHLSLLVDRQESLARDEAVAALGETGDALFRSVRDAYRAQALRGALPEMESILAVPGLLELVSPPWEVLLRAMDLPSVEAPSFEASPIVEPPSVPDVPVQDIQRVEPVVVAPVAKPVDEPARAPAVSRAARPAAATAVDSRPSLYGVEIDPREIEAGRKIVDQAREAVMAGEPNAFFAFDKYVGRHKWRKELYQVVFRDESSALGLPLPGEASSVSPSDAPDASVHAATTDTYDGDVPDDDIVFGDDEGYGDTTEAPSIVEQDVPAFLSDTSDGPSPGQAGDESDSSWLRPFDEGARDAAPPEVDEPERRVVTFAPPRAPPLRPAKVAPGLARPVN